MRLAASGHPLHTRALSVELRHRSDGKLDVHGYVLDLRKRGFVPVAGELQPSGIVHHMELRGVVDPAARVIEQLSAHQPAIAFEATATTEGESCRDLAGRVAALGGTRLDVGWSRRLSEEIGGPRGCSHVLTLAQMLGPSIGWGLTRDQELHGLGMVRPAGQRVYRRDIIIDGLEPEDGRLELAAQLIDLHDAPAPERARPMERFGGSLEVRAQVLVDYRTYSIAGLLAAERWRARDDLGAEWQDRTAEVAGLTGTFLFRGVTSAILQHLGPDAAERPLGTMLLQVAPTMIQVNAALSESWPAVARQQNWFVGMGGFPDSCYMWRRGGPLERARSPEDPPILGRG